MEVSSLKPYLRDGLDILFVGLNPATGSSRNGHYFSVNSAFWNQIYDAGLITHTVDKYEADEMVFGTNRVNAHGWNYGITDLVTTIAESDSSKITPTDSDCCRLIANISRYRPRTVVLMQSKVISRLAGYIGRAAKPCGRLGNWLNATPTTFFSVYFPHGNSIKSHVKVAAYRDIKLFLEGRL